MAHRDGIQCLLGIALVISMILVAYAPIGYADTSYTATTTSAGSTISASYGVLSINDGTNGCPLENALKAPFTTTAGSFTTISNSVITGYTLPNSITLTFNFSNMVYSSGNSTSSFNKVGVVLNGSETSWNLNNGSATNKTVQVQKSVLQSIGLENGVCTIPITVKIYNNGYSSRDLDQSAAMTVSVNSGSVRGHVLFRNVTVPARSNASIEGTLDWTCSNVTTDDYWVHYSHNELGNSPFTMTFTISNIAALNGSTFRATLGSVNQDATISSGAATVSFNLNMSSGEYDGKFSLWVKSNSAGTYGMYTITIDATYTGCSAINAGSVSAIATPEEAVQQMGDVNPTFNTDESDYNMTDNTAGNHGNNPAVNISNENNPRNPPGISDARGEISVDIVIPQGAEFVLYLKNESNTENKFYITMTRNGESEPFLQGTATFNGNNSKYLSAYSYDGSSHGYFYSTIAEVNNYEAWMYGNASDITININTDGDLSASTSLRLDIVFRGS